MLISLVQQSKKAKRKKGKRQECGETPEALEEFCETLEELSEETSCDQIDQILVLEDRIREIERKTPKKVEKKDDKERKRTKKKDGETDWEVPFFLHDKFIHGSYALKYVFDPAYVELFSYSKFGHSYYEASENREAASPIYGTETISNAQVEKMIAKKKMQAITKLGKLYSWHESPWLGTKEDQEFRMYSMFSWNFAWNMVKYSLSLN